MEEAVGRATVLGGSRKVLVITPIACGSLPSGASWQGQDLMKEGGNMGGKREHQRGGVGVVCSRVGACSVQILLGLCQVKGSERIKCAGRSG